MKKKFIKTIVIAAALFSAMAFAADNYFEVSKNFDIFSALFKDVNTYYVDDVEPSKLMRTAIDGMLKTLDPFTNYFSGSQIENAKIQQGGKFGGIGIETAVVDGYPLITSVWQNQPADKAGIKVGDIIKTIDGDATKGRTQEEVDKFLVGQPNSSVRLEIERRTTTGRQMLTLDLARQEIQETSVPFYGMITPDVACIRLKIFNENAGNDVKHAFDSLKKANPNLKGLIVDLRGNPGGLLQEAVNIVNVFVPKNQLVVSTKGKLAEWNKSFSTANEPSDTKIPLVFITNSMSASASEIVSGAMQDLDRGVVIGQRTYGKGLVQITKPLSYNTMLKVTTAKYYIPSGRCIQALIYAEHNPDGSVMRVPDSLKHEFRTKGGRPVWDGGGIEPDVLLPKEEQSRLLRSLYDKHYIFDFATQYAQEHSSISDPAEFKLSDRDFDDFVAYVTSKNWSYETGTEEKLDALKDAATDEKYFDAVQEEYNIIRKKIQERKEHDLLQYKAEVLTALENEIVGRYYYAYGKTKKSYQNDKEVAKAVEILNNTTEYRHLLSAKK